MSEVVTSNQSQDIRSVPANWMRVRLPEIATINPALNKSEIDDNLLVSFVPMPAVEAENGRIDVSTHRKFAEVKKGYTGFLEGDVLFAKITPCMENGKMAVVPVLQNDLGFGSTEFHVLRSADGISPDYLYYFVSSKAFRIDAERNMTGAVGQRRVPTTYLEHSEIPLPPAAEQQRIVAKLEELFSELDKGVENLRTAQQQLKVYRQALLKHAFEGKLTAEWRAHNPEKLESAEALLGRIQQEREAHYQRQLAEWKETQKAWEATDKTGSKPAKPREPRALPPLTTEEKARLPDLPKGWGWTRLGMLIDEPCYGTSKKCSYESGKVGVLRIPNISSGRIDAGDLKFADFDNGEIAAYTLKCGDILTIRSNGSISLVGQCALITEAEENFLYAGYLIKLRPNQNIASSSFLLETLGSHALRKQIEHKAKSTSGVNNINSGEIQSLVVPLCSVEEQEIVKVMLSEKLSNLDQLEQTIATSLQQAESLRESILKKAFSGRLVPQRPDDEPASVLLERIRAERAAQQPAARRGRQRRVEA